MRPLVFRRIIVWHHLLFSAWVRRDCFGGKQNNIIGSESLLPKATCCFKILCFTFALFEQEVSVRPTLCCLLFPYVWRDMLVVPVNLLLCVWYTVSLLTHFFIFCVFVSDWGFVIVFGALSLWCVATKDLKLLFCVLASKKECLN